jgi:hypothetical protein
MYSSRICFSCVVCHPLFLTKKKLSFLFSKRRKLSLLSLKDDKIQSPEASFMSLSDRFYSSLSEWKWNYRYLKNDADKCLVLGILKKNLQGYGLYVPCVIINYINGRFSQQFIKRKCHEMELKYHVHLASQCMALLEKLIIPHRSINSSL